MTEREQLVAEIVANPDCDTLRLAFADWCDEHGEAARAEFVRAQVRGENPRPLSAQAREWLPVWWRPSTLLVIDRLKGRVSVRDGHGQTFPCSRRVVARRGFAESVTCTLSDWLAHGPAICAAHPIRRVTLGKEPILLGTGWGFGECHNYSESLGRCSIAVELAVGTHPSPGKALTALSDACILWARRPAPLAAREQVPHRGGTMAASSRGAT
jgi:uncharacterized protein (TIGR02996 family)